MTETRRTHQAYYSEKLFETGMGYAIVCRFKGGGRRLETGVFLIDAWCLGVKNAFYTELTPDKLKSALIDKMPPESAVIPIDPCCARKLVEEAARYALSLGFAPHRDYKKGAKVFGGLDARKCQQQFTFGKDSKPLYVQGPHENPELAERIMNQLHRRCGEGNYHFLVAAGPVGDFIGEDEDEEEHELQDSDLSQSLPTSDSVPPPPRNIKEMAGLLRALTKDLPKKNRAEFERLRAKTEPLLDYLEKKDAIEAATAALEAYREEYKEFTTNQAAYFGRMRSLFSEECFATYRFTAEDIRRAFKQVGYPAGSADNRTMMNHIASAILYLADTDLRDRLSMNLMRHLPDYVAAERYMDGWMIQHSAINMVEFENELNPFLFEMFSHGYSAWLAEYDEHEKEVLGALEMDPDRLRSMDLKEVEAWLKEQQADPAKLKKIEAILDKNPEQRELAIAKLQQMEREAVKILDRAEARDMLLAPQEIEPFLPRFQEYLERARDTIPALASNQPPKEDATGQFVKLLLPFMREMAQAIFTPPRIQQLVALLQKFHDDQVQAGDKEAMGWALAAINSLKHENEPGMNYFLVALCVTSIQLLFKPDESLETNA